MITAALLVGSVTDRAHADTVGPVHIISSASDGTPANYTTSNGRVSRDIAWSPDGSRIAFRSDATNLVPNPPTGGEYEVYIKHLSSGQTTMISRASDGSAGPNAFWPQWSPDGSKLAFFSGAFPRHLVIADSESGQLTTLSQNDGSPIGVGDTAVWSPDGNRMAFVSNDPNLPSEGSSYLNLYIQDLATRDITLVSAPDTGDSGADGHSEHPAWSPSGRYLAFDSEATSLIGGASSLYRQKHAYVYDTLTGDLALASATASGVPANGSTHVAHVVDGPNHALYDHRVWSPDGSKLVFASDATNLVPGTAGIIFEIYAKDLATGAIQLVSSTADGTPGDNSASEPMWSPDGTRIGFESQASNLGGSVPSVYVKTLATGVLVPLVALRGAICGCSSVSVWSPSGKWISFGSDGGLYAQNVVTGDVVTFAPAGSPLASRPVWSPNGKRLAFELIDASRISTASGDHIVMREIIETPAAGGTSPPDPPLSEPSSLPASGTSPIGPSSSNPCARVKGGIAKRLLAAAKCTWALTKLEVQCGIAIAGFLFLPIKSLKAAKTSKGLLKINKLHKHFRAAGRLYNRLSLARYSNRAPKGFRTFGETLSSIKKAKTARDFIKLLPRLRDALSAQEFGQVALDVAEITGLKPCVEALSLAMTS